MNEPREEIPVSLMELQDAILSVAGVDKDNASQAEQWATAAVIAATYLGFASHLIGTPLSVVVEAMERGATAARLHSLVIGGRPGEDG